MEVQTADPWISISLAVCVGMLLALPPLVLSENGWGGVTYQVAVLRPAAGNLDPVARLHLVLDDVGTVLANASASMDPDGDGLQYRFSLGDGTYTGWQDSPVVYHNYGSDGNYTCTLKVRDLRGGESGRVSATIDAGGPVPNRPPTACLLASSTELAPGVSIGVDAQLSEDRDDDPLEYRFDWGDGSVAEWAELPCLEHVYGKEGSYTIILQVRDPGGLLDSASIEVVVGEAWLLIAGLMLATSALRYARSRGMREELVLDPEALGE